MRKQADEGWLSKLECVAMWLWCFSPYTEYNSYYNCSDDFSNTNTISAIEWLIIAIRQYVIYNCMSSKKNN